MKVLAINSSPRKEGQSKTEMMLSHLVNGMQAAGAEVETVHLRDKTIRYCAGCFKPGFCLGKLASKNQMVQTVIRRMAFSPFLGRYATLGQRPGWGRACLTANWGASPGLPSNLNSTSMAYQVLAAPRGGP